MSTASDNLNSAAHAVSTAVLLLRLELPTMEAFLKESADMESFGHIVDPTLYRDSERRAAAAVVEPLFKAAVEFVRQHDLQLSKAKAALEKVKA